MAARAIWKGKISFAGVEVPVKLYSAIQDRAVHFRLLHERELVPVKQKLVNPRTGEEVPRDRMQKGAPADKGRFVVLREDELASLEPPRSRTISIGRFVEPRLLDHAWYDRPYWLGPDAGGESTYRALAQALARSGREGIARWVMRKRPYLGVLRAAREHLILVTLRHAGEVVETSEFQAPSGRKPDPKELQMARQLVAVLVEPFEPREYRDEHRERVLELIERKAKGEKIELPAPEEKRRRAGLADALEASLGLVRRERGSRARG